MLRYLGIPTISLPLTRRAVGAANATVRLPLYYTGVHDVALVSVDEAPPTSHTVARDFSLSLPLRMRPRSVTTVVVSDGAPRRFT